MKIPKRFSVHLATLVFGSAMVLSAQTPPTASQPEDVQAERFWIAGRYDGNRVIVYFDAVKFNGTIPSIAERLTDPVVMGFFMPEKLPWTYVTGLQNRHGAEHFKLGDKYDLLLDEGKVATVTLSTLVGTVGDEGVGNDSYIGALAILDDKDDAMFFSRGYYVMRRHRELPPGASKLPPVRPAYPGLEREPVRFDIQVQILDLLTQRMKTTASEAERRAVDGISPTLAVQAFRLADSTLRYYAEAAWTSGEGMEKKNEYALACWVAPEPKLHIMAEQKYTSPYAGLDNALPTLLNVIDLGQGKTGIIVSFSWEDSAATELLEYVDGQDLGHMHVLQSLAAGE